MEGSWRFVEVVCDTSNVVATRVFVLLLVVMTTTSDVGEEGVESAGTIREDGRSREE